MSTASADLVPPRLLDIAAEIGASARLYLPDAREAFATRVREVDDTSILLECVRPRHGNLVLERVRSGLRLEITVAGVPVVGTTTVLDVSEGGVRVSLPAPLARVQRRRYFRVPAPDGADVQIQLGNDIRCRALVDLSCIGVAFRAHPSDADLVPGKVIELLQFSLPCGRVFVAGATVKQRSVRGNSWASDRIVGVEFEGVSPRDRDRLQAWVRERERVLLRERALEPPREVPDGLLVVHGPGNSTRLRAATQLAGRWLTIPLYDDDDDDIIVGVQLAEVELRVGGASVLRTAMWVERVTEVAGRREARLGFAALRLDDRRRLEAILRSG